MALEQASALHWRRRLKSPASRCGRNFINDLADFFQLCWFQPPPAARRSLIGFNICLKHFPGPDFLLCSVCLYLKHSERSRLYCASLIMLAHIIIFSAVTIVLETHHFHQHKRGCNHADFSSDCQHYHQPHFHLPQILHRCNSLPPPPSVVLYCLLLYHIYCLFSTLAFFMVMAICTYSGLFYNCQFGVKTS